MQLLKSIRNCSKTENNKETSMTQKRSYKRRQVFIKKEYQFKFIAKFCFILLISGTISTGLVTLLSRGTLTTSFEHGRLTVTNTASAILPTVILTNIVTLAIVTLIAVLTVLYLSHKIAGPMFRLEKDMSAVKEGDLTLRVFLRKKDQFTALSESFNNMTAGLHDKVKAISSEIDQIQTSAKKHDLPQAVIDDLESLNHSIHDRFEI